MSHELILGWDLGGAHLKRASLDGAGRLLEAAQRPCPLWQGMDSLHRALREAWPRAARGARIWHALTMTGEMADCFADRQQGVRRLLAAFQAHSQAAPLWVYAGAQGWLAPEQAARTPAAIASQNWRARAQALARRLPAGLLVDIGSTTSDLVPWRSARVCARGQTDHERLACGELVYSGVVRTPLMALAVSAPVAGRDVPLMAERFATTADVYRLLGDLPRGADQQPSADGGPKTRAASRRRLARMVGCDARERAPAVWDALAGWFAQAQLAALERAARRVLRAARLPAAAPVVAAGVGEFLARRLARRLGRPCVGYAQALGLGRRSAAPLSWHAPALAVAVLLREARP
jgi:probable H4MPT-linked C1 transfer pathway protein